MGAPVILRNATDAHISEKYKTTNTSNSKKIYLTGGGSADTRFGFFYFAKPFPANAKITKARFRVWNGTAWPGSITLTVNRVMQSWSVTKIHWNNRPSVSSTDYSVTKSGAAANTMWEFDIMPMIQSIANGGAWYGLRLEINNNTGGRWIHSTQASSRRPELEIEWVTDPEPPTQLNPSGGRAVSVAKPYLTFNFNDYSGNLTLGGVHVQIDPAQNWGAPAWDSGERTDILDPELDLSTTTYPGLAEDATTYWRVRVMDSTGVWSGWSVGAQIKRDSFGAITIINPAVGSPAFVEDDTPPFMWSYAGGGHTQTAYQLTITEANDPTVLWTSGKISGTETEYTPPSLVITDPTATYRLHLWVWDEVAREKEGSRPAYATASRDFVYQATTDVAPVTNLTVEQEFPWPWLKITWKSSTPPDSFTILRGGKVVETKLLPSEVFVSGTDYTYYARVVPPRQDFAWEVRREINRRTSANNPSVTRRVKTNWSWLTRTDATDPIALLKLGSEKSPVVEASSTSLQEMHEPVGGTSPILITQYIRGYQGKVTAILSDDILPGVTARMMRDRFKKFMAEKGNTLLLYWVDEVMTIVPYNMNYRPRAVSGSKVIYEVEFDFFEVTS